MPNVIAQLHQKAKENPQRIIFPESADPRVVTAAAQITSQGLAIPVLIVDDRDTKPSEIGHIETVSRTDPERS